MSIWAVQFVGREIRLVNYYEAVGQPLAAHLTWMREQGYKPAHAQVWLPHDGSTHDKVYDVSYESAIRDAGYDVTVVPNQGRGAAKAGSRPAVASSRRCGSTQSKCAGGLDALGWYHEKRDETRAIGLGPDHDWASHAADAFGLMAVVAEDIQNEQQKVISDPYRGFEAYAG